MQKYSATTIETLKGDVRVELMSGMSEERLKRYAELCTAMDLEQELTKKYVGDAPADNKAVIENTAKRVGLQMPMLHTDESDDTSPAQESKE